MLQLLKLQLLKRSHKFLHKLQTHNISLEFLYQMKKDNNKNYRDNM